jgi:L-lactate dehydrogenase complex protein LldE
MLRELRIEEQPEQLLQAVDGVDLVACEASQRCCGFGGLFAVKLPETSEAMADHKLEQVRACGADVVCGSDASCLLHLRTRASHEGEPVRTRHLAQLLADALPSEP